MAGKSDGRKLVTILAGLDIGGHRERAAVSAVGGRSGSRSLVVALPIYPEILICQPTCGAMMRLITIPTERSNVSIKIGS